MAQTVSVVNGKLSAQHLLNFSCKYTHLLGTSLRLKVYEIHEEEKHLTRTSDLLKILHAGHGGKANTTMTMSSQPK